MNKKTILSIALVCVLLVSSGAVASGVFSSFAREKAPMEVEEQKISPMTFPPELPLPPELPPMPVPPELPPMPIVPEIPPVEIPETFNVSWLLDQLENNVTFPDGFDWLKENMTKCLDECITDGPGDLDLSDPENQTVFIQFVVSWWEKWLEVYGDDPYAPIIAELIVWLNEWLKSPERDINDLIEYLENSTPLIPEQPPEESPEQPPEESPEEPPVELPELPEVITVNMILDQLQNNVTVPEIFGWLYLEIISCLDSYPEEKKDDNLREKNNLTAFIDHVVGCLGNLVLPEGFEQYQSLIVSLIKCLEEWEGEPDELIDYLLACIEGWATTPVPIPPEIPIIPGF